MNLCIWSVVTVAFACVLSYALIQFLEWRYRRTHQRTLDSFTSAEDRDEYERQVGLVDRLLNGEETDEDREQTRQNTAPYVALFGDIDGVINPKVSRVLIQHEQRLAALEKAEKDRRDAIGGRGDTGPR